VFTLLSFEIPGKAAQMLADRMGTQGNLADCVRNVIDLSPCC
jgi:hypothetical protein